MVGGCITYHGVGEILILGGSVNTEKYLKIIKEGAYPTILEVSHLLTQLLFQDDNAPFLFVGQLRWVNLNFKNENPQILEVSILMMHILHYYKQRLGISSLNWPGSSSRHKFYWKCMGWNRDKSSFAEAWEFIRVEKPYL